MNSSKLLIPADVPEEKRGEYGKNFEQATQGSGRLMLFAGDQKVEHLNDDFVGEGISADDADPEHLFKIAKNANVGIFAAQLGLVARYGGDYKDVPYLIKLNSKTNLVKTAQRDPLNGEWFTIRDIVEFKKTSGLKILAVGYTVYIGSELESRMLREAAKAVLEAHRHGLLTVLWMYPRGAAVKDEKDPHLIAGAAGVAACLGSDFTKINFPKVDGKGSANALKEAVVAAGRTRVICAGGSATEASAFLQTLHDQIHIAGASGNATGRNIHQKPYDEALRFCNAIHALTVEGRSVEDAIKIYNG